MWWLAAATIGCTDPSTSTAGPSPTDPNPPTQTTTAPPTAPPTDTTPPTTPSPADCPPGSSPSLSTTTGCVLGGVTASGTEQFLAIPYAEPPIGALRFAPPVPIAPWSEPRDGTTLGEPCVQFGVSSLGELVPDLVGPGVEDCLTLNVFRPPGAVDLPVMVFVHGGGHVSGSGTSSYIVDDPELAEQAIVVSMNYRLGPLGFLAHPELSDEDPDGVSGNLGLQDVITALRWVRSNVTALGGDPSRLILFGESAGGLETCAVLASPRAAGLMDAAIIESAPCGSLASALRDPPPLGFSAEDQGETFAEAVGCATPGDVPACLRALPLDTLVEVGTSGVGPLSGSEWAWEPWVDDVWMPNVAQALLDGDWNQVPVIASTNADEGTVFTAGLAPTQAELDQWVSAFALVYGVDADAIAAQYDPALYGGSTERAFAALFGDSAFICPTVWQQEVIASQVPARGAWWVQVGFPADLGAFHGSEVPYVFGTLGALASPPQEDLSRRMQAAWRSAADPAPAWTDLGPWPTVTDGWVELDTDPSRLIASPKPDACALFEDSRANPFR